MAAKARVTITIDMRLLKELDGWAKKTKRSRSSMTEVALQEWLEEARLGFAVIRNPTALEALGKALSDRDVLRELAQAMGSQITEKDFQDVQGLFAKLASESPGPGGSASGKGGA